MLKGIFNLTLRATQGLLDSLFELMNVCRCAHRTIAVSAKRARTGDGGLSTAPKGGITDLVIDSTGLKVFGEGEWKVKTRRREAARWRKLHLGGRPGDHDIVAAEVSLENVHDAEVLPTLLNPTAAQAGTCLCRWCI